MRFHLLEQQIGRYLEEYIWYEEYHQRSVVLVLVGNLQLLGETKYVGVADIDSVKES